MIELYNLKNQKIFSATTFSSVYDYAYSTFDKATRSKMRIRGGNWDTEIWFYESLVDLRGIWGFSA